MKYEYSSQPESLRKTWPGQYEIFSWIELVTSIPQSLNVITTLKEGRIPNVCPQSWTSYAGDSSGYYVITSMLNNNHTCKNILRDGVFVVNFPDADILPVCLKAIELNSDETDEISACGLTAESSKVIDAPRIKECFLNLECRLGWERPLHEGSHWHVFAGEVVHVAIDGNYTGAGEYRRTGPGGFIYNIHSPVDPETGKEDASMIGIIQPVKEL